VLLLILLWPAHCDDLPELANAVVLSGSSAIRSTVTFVCETGFQMADNSSLVNSTCLSNRTWDDDLSGVSCERESASALLLCLVVGGRPIARPTLAEPCSIGQVLDSSV